jgi:diacylglycerol kinase (ATP)
MRAAAILGPGSSARTFQLFQKNSDISWMMGLPANPNEAEAILIFGGDGTIHRHLAQLVKQQLPVLIVPCGSGNDFARALHLRSIQDARAAWRKFTSGSRNVRTIDLGVIAFEDSAKTRTSTYFCCAAGVGLDTEIARHANRLPRWLRGHGGYALSLPSALLGFKAQSMKILAADAKGTTLVPRSDQPTVASVFANTPTYGGGMKIAPHAVLDDGLLDVCVVGDVARLRLLRLFPSVYFGTHLKIPKVDYFQSARLRLETDAPMDVYADGEYVCRTPIEVDVAQQALTVLVP